MRVCFAFCLGKGGGTRGRGLLRPGVGITRWTEEVDWEGSQAKDCRIDKTDRGWRRPDGKKKVHDGITASKRLVVVYGITSLKILFNFQC